MALSCVISANSGSCRAHCVKVHVRYLISWWVLVVTVITQWSHITFTTNSYRKKLQNQQTITVDHKNYNNYNNTDFSLYREHRIKERFVRCHSRYIIRMANEYFDLFKMWCKLLLNRSEKAHLLPVPCFLATFLTISVILKTLKYNFVHIFKVTLTSNSQVLSSCQNFTKIDPMRFETRQSRYCNSFKNVSWHYSDDVCDKMRVQTLRDHCFRAAWIVAAWTDKNWAIKFVAVSM